MKRYELLDWARFFLREMRIRKIQIERKILDEFLKLNLVVKTMKRFFKKNEENQKSKRPIGFQNMKYHFSRAGFRRIRQIYYNLRRGKMNVAAASFYPAAMKEKHPKKNLNLNSSDYFPAKNKNENQK